MIAPLAVALLACAPCARPPAASPASRRVREPAAAGRFYPSDAAKLESQVAGFLSKAKKTATAKVRMVLVPHAGLEYSGQIAAEAFKQVEPGSFDRAVIIAANHSNEADYQGLSVDRATHYRVPGLEVKVAKAAEGLLGRPGFVDVPGAHTLHMIELELPFLRAANGKAFELVPLVAGRLDPAAARVAAGELLKLAGPRTLFVFSVDLSHFYPYDEAVALDRPCLDALSRSDAQGVSACNTDGTQVLFLMNELSARLALTPRLLGYANSGDRSGDKAQVVGYGALAYEERFELGADEGAALVALARRALESRVREGKTLEVPAELAQRWPRLMVPRGAFVTLKAAGELRGCIGSLAPAAPLALDVINNAINAAMSDSRFAPVKADELPDISLSVSVLELPRPLEGLGPVALAKRLGETRPGLILEFGGRRSTFLPEVWEQLPGPEQFLAHLCAKQGSPEECWR
ncbi:MAG: AmmeMemoRadiSam system protein B, partial [Myxococcaceae bacterium]